MGKIYIRILGFVLSGAIIFWLILKVDSVLLYKYFLDLETVWLPVMALFYLFGFVIRGIRWRFMLVPIKRVGIRIATEGVFVGYTGNNILPARAGEFLRAIFLGSRESISKATVLGTVFMERIFDGLVIVGILFICSLFLPPKIGHHRMIYTAIVSGFLLFGALVLLTWVEARCRPWMETRIQRIIRLLPGRISIPLSPIVGHFFNALAFLRTNNKLGVVFLLSVVIWGMEGLVFLIGFTAIRSSEHFLLAYFTMAFVNLGMILPSAPGGIGVFQGGTVLAFSLFGLTPERALGYSIVVQGVMIIPVTIIGLFILNWHGISIWKTV